MYRFWEDITKKCFELANIKNIIEIGCDIGLHTKKLLKYCKENDGFLYIVDPKPRVNVEQEFEEYKDYFKHYENLSLNVLGTLKDYDAVLIDGDHNWYTVYNELILIKKNATKFPIIFFHDISWPYDRRDLYYNPDNIPTQYINPYQKKGININTDELTDTDGFNGSFNNSIYYNNNKCGVLTAIEDFLNEDTESYRFVSIPLFNGFGILYPLNTVFPEKLLEFFDDIEVIDCIKEIMKKNDKYYAREHVRLLNEQYKVRTINEKLEYQLNNKKLELEIEELQNNINLLNDQVEDLQNNNKVLKNQLLSMKEQHAICKENLDLLNKENGKSYIEIESLKSQVILYKVEGEKHFNSIRYRIGTAIIESSKSIKDLFKLPNTIFKLYIEGKVKEDALMLKKNSEIAEIKGRVNKKKDSNIKYDKIKYNKDQIIEINKQLLLKNTNKIEGKPYISIIIINHNGFKNLNILFDSLNRCNFYRNFEIIFVDNNSNDKSAEYISGLKDLYDIKLIKNNDNVSFSCANNQAAKISKGDYLLFLNNDIEVTDFWLDELIITMQSDSNAAIVGAKLIYPKIPQDSINAGKSFKLQHSGISFIYSNFENKYFIRPYNMGNGDEPFDGNIEGICKRGAVTAATMLIEKKIFQAVGGFDEGFIYGYEDVDLCLKVGRIGRSILYCSTSVLFHYEFGTQDKSSNDQIIKRRSNNINLFKGKWHNYLEQVLLEDKLSKNCLYSTNPLTVAFVVTDDNKNTSAGDYFTAYELASSLEKLGYNTKYLSKKGNYDWYDVGEDVDVLISMLDSFDVTKIKNCSLRLITIAWARNWFERWCEKSYIKNYNLIFASSGRACEYIKDKIGVDAILFPIATNYERFSSVIKNENNSGLEGKYKSDYVFTGSYWNDPREIIDIINPQELNYEFKVFGENWDKVEKFKKYNGGFVKYNEIPYVYKFTKIVVDDANRVTKGFGAVNSRVFDAIAAGKLVITNGIIGASETFEGKLPSFRNKKEFNYLINYYMDNPDMKQNKIDELQDFVLKSHTYDIRARKLVDIIKDKYRLDPKKIAIMIPVPKWDEAKSWGDYHFAIAMKKYFERNGYVIDIRILPEWNTPFYGKNVIVLRGLSKYNVRNEHRNIMWNISHPDDISIEEYNSYDMVYISSEKWTNHIKESLQTKVMPLLQCTDSEVFNPNMNSEKKYEILFVGNSRKVFRKIIKDLLPTDKDLSIYGTNWGQFVDNKYIKGEYLDNNKLGQAYHDSQVLLNDHWDDMREKGFISNRIFDGLSSGAFIISDEIDGINDILDGCIVTYKDKLDLKEKIQFYLNNPELRKEISTKGMNIVRNKHTFENRIDEMIKYLCEDYSIK